MQVDRARSLGVVLSGLLLCAGCTDPEPTSADPDASAVDPVDASAPDATPEVSWTELISGDWEIPAGTEFYRCVRKTVAEDTYITSFRAIAPLGTHHTVLTVGEPEEPDGIAPCNAGTNASLMIYGSGVGTNEFHFPARVGIKIPAGQQLLLNLHLFNTADEPITGTSGAEIRLASASEIEHEAESILMGKVQGLTVAPGESTQVGSCTMNGDVTVVSLFPHMHQLGTHMKIVAERADGEVLLHDAAYSFYEQKNYPVEPLELKSGEKIRVYCTYNNDTGETVGFGDSSLEEMCFAGTYRYPKRGATFGLICSGP